MVPDKELREQLWIKYVGSPDEFTMENRAFNFISLISFPLLISLLILDCWFVPGIMTYVFITLIIIQAIIYYLSRYKKKYNTVIIIYSIASYITLIINFYVNAGSHGPTLFFFFVTLNFLIAFSRPRQHTLWISMHIIIVMGLLLSEHYHPEWVPLNYNGPAERLADTGWSYAVAVAFIFSVTHYLRGRFNKEHILARDRAIEIAEQNRHIVTQNRQLEKVNEEKDKLFSIVSHDLKSPLDAITGYLEILSQDMLTAGEKTQIEADLAIQTKYTSDMLLNLLSWSKSQMQGINVHLSVLSVREVIDRVVAGKLSFAGKKDITLTCNIDPALEVSGDKEMLNIVIRNLVNNAIKFTPPGGDIYIRAHRAGHYVDISVQDTGIGIAAEKQHDIFSTKTRSTFGTNNEKGMGMGLVICRQFMEYLGGSIHFESEVGKGTTFHISLPLTKKQTESAYF